MALETPLWAAPQTALSTSSRVPTKMARSQKPCRTKTLFRGIDVRDHSGPKSDEHTLLYERVCDILKGINVEKAEARNLKDREDIMYRIKTGPGILKTNLVVAAALDWDGDGFQDLAVSNNQVPKMAHSQKPRRTKSLFRASMLVLTPAWLRWIGKVMASMTSVWATTVELSISSAWVLPEC